MNNRRLLTKPIYDAWAASAIAQMKGPPMTQYHKLFEELVTKNPQGITAEDQRLLKETHDKELREWHPNYVHLQSVSCNDKQCAI